MADAAKVRERLRAAAQRFADELADILGVPGEPANDAPPPPRAPRRPAPLYRPAADVTDLDRERADRVLKRRGFLTPPAKKAPR